MQPSTDSLVYLSESPTLVITLADVEIAHLERVQYGLRNFDLVFVMQDFKRAPVHINTVPAKSLEDVKEWLDSVDIPYSEGPVNLNWGQIVSLRGHRYLLATLMEIIR
jgi:nucleosome binding factor SPN SPT16 subunit